MIRRASTAAVKEIAAASFDKDPFAIMIVTLKAMNTSRLEKQNYLSEVWL